MKYYHATHCILLFCLSPLNLAADTTCRVNAAGVVAEMRSGEFTNMTEREILIARHAAMAACDATFVGLESNMEAAKNAPQDEGIDPGKDPVGWLKEQWNKPPLEKKGLERLKKRAGR